MLRLKIFFALLGFGACVPLCTRVAAQDGDVVWVLGPESPLQTGFLSALRIELGDVYQVLDRRHPWHADDVDREAIVRDIDVVDARTTRLRVPERLPRLVSSLEHAIRQSPGALTRGVDGCASQPYTTRSMSRGDCAIGRASLPTPRKRS